LIKKTIINDVHDVHDDDDENHDGGVVAVVDK
jgi:hypothetical protein